jgi:hypothetical protein
MTDDFILTPPDPAGISRYGMLCCPECFKDEWVRAFIEQESRRTGTCEFCEANDVPLLEVSILTKPFLNLTSMYSPVNDDNTMTHIDYIDAGESLDFFVEDEWDIFSARLSDLNRVAYLLGEILDARYTEAEWRNLPIESYENRFNPTELYTSRRNPVDFTWSDAWDEHKDKVLVSLGAAPPFAITREYLERAMAILPINSELYRARNGYIEVSASKYVSHKEPYCGDMIGAPPASLIPAGRANRAGQVVLYCADQEETAVAEVRPARGFLVSVGKFRAQRDFRLLDLVMRRRPINPFMDPELSESLHLNGLFRAFAKDLETPLERGDDTSLYLPCQNLTDAVRAAGFDGIRFPSAMKPGGSNVVLFDPATVEYVNSKLVEVTGVEIEFRPPEDGK